MFVMLYVTRIVLRTLGAEDFGIYDVVGGAISMLGFVNTAMASAVQRFLNNAQAKNDSVLQRKVYNVGVVFHIAIATTMVIVFAILFVFLFNGILNISPQRIKAAKIVYLCLVVSTFISIITVPYDASINAHEDLLTYSIIGIIDIFLKLGVAIAIVHTSMDKLVLYAILMMIVPLATFVMMKVWCKRHYDECVISVRQYYDKGLAKQMLSFSGWSLLGTTSNLVGNYGSSIVLNHFFGTVLNAVMGIANQFQGMLIVLSTGMLRSLNPVIYKSGESDPTRLMLLSFKGCKFSFLLLAIFAIPVMVETPFVLHLWLGDVPEWAVIFVRLQLLRCLLEQLTTTFNRTLESVGKIKELNIYTFVLNLCPIVVLSVLYAVGYKPYWHFIVAIFFMVILAGAMKIYYCIKYCGINLGYYFQMVVRPCVLYIVPALLIMILYKSFFSAGTALASVGIMTVLFIAILVTAYLLLDSREKEMIFFVFKRHKG